MKSQDIPESLKRLIEMEEGCESVSAGNPRKLPALLERLRQQELAANAAIESAPASRLRKAG